MSRQKKRERESHLYGFDTNSPTSRYAHDAKLLISVKFFMVLMIGTQAYRPCCRVPLCCVAPLRSVRRAIKVGTRGFQSPQSLAGGGRTDLLHLLLPIICHG
jgi:hypothetical protein